MPPSVLARGQRDPLAGPEAASPTFSAETKFSLKFVVRYQPEAVQGPSRNDLVTAASPRTVS